MENISPSRSSQDWPTGWAPNAFGLAPTLLAVLGLVAIIVLVAVAGLVGYVIATGYSPQRVSHSPNFGAFAVALQGLLDLAIIAYLLIVLPPVAKRSLRDLGFRMPGWNEFAVGLLGAVAMIVVVEGLGGAVDSITHATHQQQAITLFLNMREPWMRIMFAVLAAIVAPVAEELAFRVFLFNAFARKTHFWTAAALSGLLFGAAHFDIFAFVPLLCGGIVLCVVYRRSRNAWMPMLTHAIFNAVTIVTLFVAPSVVTR